MPDLKSNASKKARQAERNAKLVVVLVIVLFFQVDNQGGHLKTHEHPNLKMQNAYVIIPGYRYDVLYPGRGKRGPVGGFSPARSAALCGLLMIGKGLNTWLWWF